MTKVLAAGGLVFRKDKDRLMVLLIKDTYGKWTWPKGHAENGESSRETAIREIREETGLSRLRIVGEAGVQGYSFEKDGTSIDKEVRVYAVETDEKDISIQEEEVVAGEWLAVEEALDRIEYAGSPDILKKAIRIFKRYDK
jgi:8-oxo-dGTP pyrophosphatase MutT (NUDIX family)